MGLCGTIGRLQWRSICHFDIGGVDTSVFCIYERFEAKYAREICGTGIGDCYQLLD